MSVCLLGQREGGKMNEICENALTLYEELWGILGRDEDWLHHSQLFRAASSMVVNMLEGEGVKRKKQGRSAYSWSIARGELFETIGWVRIALIEGKIVPEKGEELRSRLEEMGNTLQKLIEDIDDAEYPIEDDPIAIARRATEQIMEDAGLH